MMGMGTIVNAAAILAGASLGLLLRRGLPERWQETIMNGVALCIVVIGLQMALKTNNIIVVVFSIVIGAMLGETMDLDGKLQRFGNWVGAMITKGGNKGVAGQIAEGFVATTLIYCVGAMAIVGSIQDGLKGDPTILYAKSTLDGITAIIFSANMGIGVALSAGSVFVYQGCITLLAGALQSIITENILSELTATGGILIMAIGVNMLKLKEIRISNLLPAIFVAGIIAYVMGCM